MRQKPRGNKTMSSWETICSVDDIAPNSGRCALLGKQQVAVFRVVVRAVEGTAEGDVDNFYAIDNHDPFSGANVLSRGIVGSMQDTVVVASPVYKQHFCLRTGVCLEENIHLRSWSVRIQGDRVQLLVQVP